MSFLATLSSLLAGEWRIRSEMSEEGAPARAVQALSSHLDSITNTAFLSISHDLHRWESLIWGLAMVLGLTCKQQWKVRVRLSQLYLETYCSDLEKVKWKTYIRTIPLVRWLAINIPMHQISLENFLEQSRFGYIHSMSVVNSCNLQQY